MSEHVKLPAVFETVLRNRRFDAVLEPDAIIRSALTDSSDLSRQQSLDLIAAETFAPGSLQPTLSFGDDANHLVVLEGELEGEATRHLLLAQLNPNGRITKLSSYMGGMRPFSLVRAKVREQLRGLPASVWRMVELAPDSGEFHEAKKAFPYADEMEFLSPILRQGAKPAPLAAYLLNHASSIYGVRQWDPLALRHEDKLFRVFEGDVAGQSIEIANVITLRDNAASLIVSYSRPWLGSSAVYTRVRRRLLQSLSADFFWASEPDYETHLLNEKSQASPVT